MGSYCSWLSIGTVQLSRTSEFIFSVKCQFGSKNFQNTTTKYHYKSTAEAWKWQTELKFTQHDRVASDVLNIRRRGERRIASQVVSTRFVGIIYERREQFIRTSNYERGKFLTNLSQTSRLYCTWRHKAEFLVFSGGDLNFGVERILKTSGSAVMFVGPKMGFWHQRKE